jgi:two-component system chemotaxis response regulator CheY
MTATALLDVLIVDDSAAIRKILQRVLRQTDLNLGEIAEAGDGTEAVEILKNRTFGLILSDINMPQMDGLQLLARIKEMDHLKNVPVIMITTEGGQGKVMEAVQLGATGYVRKPFTAEHVSHRNKQQQNKPENTAQHDHLRQAGAVPDVHKKQHHQRSFEDRNRQRHENVPAAQIDRRDTRSHPREQNQRKEYGEVHPLGYDVVFRGVSRARMSNGLSTRFFHVSCHVINLPPLLRHRRAVDQI